MDSIAVPEHALRMQTEYFQVTCGLAMASLQIRDLPDPLHRLLQRRANAQKRSLSQQALADLEAIADGEPRQRQALPSEESPESLIRSDRKRCA